MALLKQIKLSDGSTAEYIRIYPLILEKERMTARFQLFRTQETRNSKCSPVSGATGGLPDATIEFKWAELEKVGVNPLNFAYRMVKKPLIIDVPVYKEGAPVLDEAGNPVMEKMDTNILSTAKDLI